MKNDRRLILSMKMINEIKEHYLKLKQVRKSLIGSITTKDQQIIS